MKAKGDLIILGCYVVLFGMILGATYGSDLIDKMRAKMASKNVRKSLAREFKRVETNKCHGLTVDELLKHVEIVD